MKNNKPLHLPGLPVCALAAALALPAAFSAVRPAKAAVRSDAHLSAPGQPASGILAVAPGKSSGSQKSGKRTGKGIINKIELSLEDAVAIAQKEAARYYDGLRLTMVYSYDNDKVREKSSGSDGRREWWYVNFANEKSNFVSVLIADGEILEIGRAHV